ncbi:WD40-repeat-containing domain protein [Aspergillus egyptiacus]|nr:WD40-repeat-containing domain protein [Aspergillus egyptiacus]
MPHPDLTSHHVNYLIWRYLQESGHGEAAVTLQRAWNHDPQSLPFAPYIRTHALEGNSIPFTPANYFFGPLPFDSEAQKGPVEAGTSAGQPTVSSPGKVAQDGVEPNGRNSTAEAAPPQNGEESHKGDRPETNGDEVPMEVDAMNGVASENKLHITESSSLGETAIMDGDGDVNMGIRNDQEPTAAPTFTLTTGHSVGVQITPAKAADLSPHTTILDAPCDDHVTSTVWRPRDPTVVVAAGDTFCSLYKLSSTAPPVQEKLVDGKGDNVLVTAVAWDPLGQKLAVATYNDMRGSITMYDVDGNAVDLLPEVPRMISALKWADFGSQLMIVASDSKISELVLWDDSLRPEEFPPPQVVDDSILDIAWLGNSQAFACGGISVYHYNVDSSINLSRTFSDGDPEQPWTFIRSANAGSTPVAVAVASSSASFWVPTHDIRMINAHEGPVTAVQLKPNPSEQANQPLILASSSTDDTVKLWHINLESQKFECIHHLSLGPSLPVLASCFSPDGYALAAASKDSLSIWNAQRGGTALASWVSPGVKKTESGDGKSPAINGHGRSIEDVPDRSLAWDMDGKRLAFGIDSQLAIINFQR